MTNYQELRAQTLGSAQEEEAVTVNTRALIDKVLARYSSENTTLRELIQNAADANATSVEIRYETIVDGTPTRPYDGEGDELERLVKSKVRRLIVKNDGQAFREEDWQRLKRIAEGNPDETKIGAFGVGFYSVFADTDEPFISSGDQTMAFFWKGNSLYTRRAKMDNVDPSTTFLLDYREPGDLPDLKVLCQFFATSLTFVKLNTISLYINNVQMLVLNKKVSPPMPLDIPKSISLVSKERYMKIVEVETSRVQLDAKYMNITHYKPPKASENSVTGLARIFFGRSSTPANSPHITTSNLGEYTTAAIFLCIATATIATSVPQKFAQELERATKKPPPRRTKLECLTMSKDEQDASENESEIFGSVIPSKDGRIFIGFPTHQTTGIKAHISAHSVIPTVERENIDLNARIVKTWNAEMLRAAGILARILYIDEMNILGRRAKGLKLSNFEELYDDAIHVMRQFTSTHSTPSTSVGGYIAEAFWSCTTYTSIELMSTKGVLPSNKVRLASDVTFLEGLPFLPQKLVAGAKVFVDDLIQGGYLLELTVMDIQNALSEKPLNGDQTHQFLKWLSQQIQTGKIDDLQAPMLLSSAIAMVPSKDVNGEVVENSLPMALGTIRYFLNVSRLAPDIPLPPECLPFTLTKRLSGLDFEALKWIELGVPEWVRYATVNSATFPVEHNIDQSPQFANLVLSIVSKNWDHLSSVAKAALVNTLEDRTCIPTKQGMKVPKEAYFANVKLFSDLPIIHGLRNVKDKLLAALGVRKTVELRLVFERLMSDQSTTGEKWSHVDLIKYLTSVRDDIPAEDVRRLCNAEMCKAEPSTSTKLYKVSELYEPLDTLRTLTLPVLYWPGEWREQSTEAKFLLKLGLKRHPPEEVLLKLAAGSDKKLREKALRYYVDQFHANNYSLRLVGGTNMAFLPLENDKERLVRPVECYSNADSKVMGFDVIRQDLEPHSVKFGVKNDPHMRACVKRLQATPPPGPREAREIFGYFMNRGSDLTMDLANELGSSLIVPVKSTTGAKHISPRICFIGDSKHKYAQVFDFVDFGTAANAFLMKCGSKPEPTTGEIAYRMAKEPDHLYEIFQDEGRYLSMLRTIAEDWSTLKRDKELVRLMKSNPCLAAYRDIPVTGKSSAIEDEDSAMREFQLSKADEIFINDDITSYNLFRVHVLAAPEEDTLERLYMSLGSTVLSASIERQNSVGPEIPRGHQVEELQKLVLERTRLFLHSNTESAAHDARWLEQNLEVQAAQYIKRKMTFKPKGFTKASKTQNRTAVIHPSKGTEKRYTLVVTPKREYYDIAVALVNLILQRPKPHSSLLLESLLSTDLMTLKHRGYNVDRILAKKQAEAKLMEQERLRKVQEQRKALEEQEARHQEARHQVEQRKQKKIEQEQQHQIKAPMPGTFGDSPEPARPQEPTDAHANFLTRGITKFQKLMQDAGRRELETERHEYEPSQPKKIGGRVPIQGGPTIHIQKPTEPHRISANLQSAVQAGRSHASNSLFSPPKTHDVKEENTFCDTRHGHDIVFAATMATGMRVYVDKSLSESQKSEFLRDNAQHIHSFSQLLQGLADVFSMAPQVLHIHYEPDVTTIAFNLNGAIFCNISFYLQLHVGRSQIEAFKYWWVTVCHELAHNLCGDHGSQHSFYTESFVVEYLDAAVQKMGELMEKGEANEELLD